MVAPFFCATLYIGKPGLPVINPGNQSLAKIAHFFLFDVVQVAVMKSNASDSFSTMALYKSIYLLTYLLTYLLAVKQ